MGAEQFFTEASGKTAKEAFAAAVEKAAYDYGHAGYTGTIAEKDEFEVAGRAHNLADATRMAEDLMEEGKFDDKWGPAGCIEYGDGYLFFGWASS